jgi:Rap1a immunity proteins
VGITLPAGRFHAVPFGLSRIEKPCIGVSFDMTRKVIAVLRFVFLFQAGAISDALAWRDQTVADFLATCAENSSEWSECSLTISTLDLYDEFNPNGTRQSCPPRTPPGMETASVVSWLKAHPATYKMMERDAILAALRALYPCHS